MIISGLNNAASAYAALQSSPPMRQGLPSPAANHADKVSISDAAKARLAESQASTSEQQIQSRIEAIKAKPAVERTQADYNYLAEHDRRLAELQDKIKTSGWKSLSADEVDYLQKAGAFVNTMAELSPQEKALYDELVANGNQEAAQGLMLVAMARVGTHDQQVTLPDGRSFDPGSTEVSAGNIRNLFNSMFDDPSGETDHQFEALASYLDQRKTADQATNQA